MEGLPPISSLPGKGIIMAQYNPDGGVLLNGIWLTAREVQILQFVSEGLINKEIAVRLDYSKKWIDKILSNSDECLTLYKKIGVRSRVEAVQWYQAAKMLLHLQQLQGCLDAAMQLIKAYHKGTSPKEKPPNDP